MNLKRHIAFISYETPYAPAGGIAAVMAYLPKAIQSKTQVPTFVITPFHFKIERTSQLEPKMETIATFDIPFDSKQITVEVKLFHKDINWVFLKPIIPRPALFNFFAGNKHPYDLGPGQSVGQSELQRDSLFFGKAASSALAEICPDCDWIVMMQDWEAATCSFYSSQNEDQSLNHSAYLTLHNSYDSGMDRATLEKAGLHNLSNLGHTVLEISLQLVRDPIFTVSEQFALDLSNELSQSEIMIPHITGQLSPRLYGINNGPFISRQFPETIYLAGLDGDINPISQWKEEKRAQAIKIIRDFTPKRDELFWGDTTMFSGADLPWFVMAGRDDSRQKGYEIACMAIDKLLEKDDSACFIFFPIPAA